MTPSVLILFIFQVILVDATHFLGGTITWSPSNASSTESLVKVIITQTYSWTWQVANCTASDIVNGARVPIGNYNGMTNILNCTGSCPSSYIAPAIWPYCTDVSPVQGSTVGRRSDIVNIPPNSDFFVAFTSNAWRPLATASAATWSIATRLNLKPRADNGLYNSAPVATMMSPINIYSGFTQVIQVPIGDADGDVIRCRWAVQSYECGDVCPPNSLPNNTMLYPNCTLVITGTRPQDWFAITIMV